MDEHVAWVEPPPAEAGGARVPDASALAQMSLLDLAMTAAQVSEQDAEAVASLRAQLLALDQYPPEYRDVARSTLEGLAAATLHQGRALASLSEQERQAFLTSDPEAPVTQEVAQAMAKVDGAELAAALTALEKSSADVLRRLEHARNATPMPADGFGEALRGATGRVGRDMGSLGSTGATPADVADLLLLASGAAGDAAARAQAMQALEGAPQEALDALATILVSLRPFAEGLYRDPAPHLVRLGASVDAARETLEVWSAMALVNQVVSPDAPPLRLPDPNSDVPPLRWNLPSYTNGVLPPDAPDMATSVRDLALLFGAADQADDAHHDALDMQEALQPEQERAIARVLRGLHDLVLAERTARQAEPPSALTPEMLGTWSAMLQNGSLVEPASSDARLLLGSVPYLGAQRDAAAAREHLLLAVEEMVATLGVGASAPASSGPVPEEDNPLCGSGAPRRILFILSLDGCGQKDTWDTDVLLSVDIGGDDRYTQRAGAPFLYDPSDDVADPLDAYPEIMLPYSILVDLGGNDTYDSEGKDCSHAAACGNHLRFPDEDPLALTPLALLIDWDGPDATATNVFRSGNHSQAYGGVLRDAGAVASQPVERHLVQPLAVLVERVGERSHLDSTYVAGLRSQGSISNSMTPGTPAYAGRGGIGHLIRLVGAGSEANGTFVAGDESQAAAAPAGYYPEGRAVASAALLNLGGDLAQSHDRYEAGALSQAAVTKILGSTGSVAQVLFADVVGQGGTSHDTYTAGDGSRGFVASPAGGLGTNYISILFLDTVLPDVQGVSPGSIVEVEGEGAELDGITIAPALDSERRSNDEYRGPIGPDRGYGGAYRYVWVGSEESTINAGTAVPFFFVDLGGDDDYDLDPDLWSAEDEEATPRNDGTWTGPDGAAAGGVDAGFHDDDQDGHIAALDQLWTAWASDANDDRYAPTPTRVVVALGKSMVLDGPHLAVVAVPAGTRDIYGPDFSAGVHFDLGGDDVNRGRPAAAAVQEDAEGTLASTTDPPLAQHGLSFLLDLQGDDAYLSTYARTQGYAEGFSAGILLDGAGSDLYEAPSHAQGVARNGTGIVVDLGNPVGDDINTFRAQEPAQGRGTLGLLVATGGHNTVDDLDDGDSDDQSVNLGSNDAPEIGSDLEIREVRADGTEVAVASSALQVGRTYRFLLDMRDPKGDDLEACWTFTYGDGTESDLTNETVQCATARGTPGDSSWRTASTMFAWNATYGVLSDWNDSTRQEHVNYTVRLDATDPGTREADPFVGNVTVGNVPPRLLSGVAGEASVFQGESRAYQVEYQAAEDLVEPVFRVDWGDGSGVEDFVGNASVNFALSQFGASTRLPDAVPVTTSRILRSVENRDLTHPRAIDGDEATTATFQYIPDSYPAIHLFVEFAEPRHISRVELDATSDVPFTFSVEGIDLDGRPVPEGRITVDGTGDDAVSGPVHTSGLPKYQGILLRQLPPPYDPDDASSALGGTLGIREVRALGPGAWHSWDQPGPWQMEYTVIDQYGGRNTTGLSGFTEADVSLLPEEVEDERTGEIRGMPVLLEDIGGRGRVRHASVPVAPGADLTVDVREETDSEAYREDDRSVFLTLQSIATDASDSVDIDWGDGTVSEDVDVADGTPDDPASFWIKHQWRAAGDHLVRIRYADASGPTGWEPLLWAHAETAFVLTAYDDGADPSHRVGNPLLWLALDPGRQAQTTWYSGHMPLAIVDAAGNDRYIDRVAAPRAAAAAPGAGANLVPHAPSLVIDATGDDDYLSLVPGTQGFGALGAVAALVDAAGDDRYVAPGMAQGAAYKQGAGMAVDLGGDDVWNPVNPVIGARPSGAVVVHPDLAGGRPDLWDPWATRPPSLEAGMRASLFPVTADLVQGSAFEGIGILVATGGHDVFNARDHAQGSARHDPRVVQFLDYAMHDPGCLSADPPSTNPSGPDAILTVNAPVLCALGIRDVGLDSGSSANLPFEPAADLEGFNHQIGPDAPRYGPAIGLLVHGDGSAAYHSRAFSQGSAMEAARAALADLDGAFSATADRNSQAFSQDGQAAFVAGGLHTTWLRREGHARLDEGEAAPEGVAIESVSSENEWGAAVYIGPGPRDTACDHATCGTTGEPGAVAPPGPIGDLGGVLWNLDQDPTPLPAGPTLQWQSTSQADETFKTRRDSDLHLALEVDPAPVVLPSVDAAIEVRVVAQPHADDDGAACRGDALGPPVLLVQDDLSSGGGTVEADMDLGTMEADLPVFPAGCYRIRAYARHVGIVDDVGVGAGSARQPATEWGRLGSDLRLLPPPGLFVESRGTQALVEPYSQPRLVTFGQSVAFETVIPEPLAAAATATAPEMEFTLKHRPHGEDASPTETQLFPAVPSSEWAVDVALPPAWSPPLTPGLVGTRIPIELDPPAQNGWYSVQVRTRWGGGTYSDDVEIARLFVDKSAPDVFVETPERLSWRGAEPTRLRGVIEDFGSDVEKLEVRLVRDEPACRADPTGNQCLAEFYTPYLNVDLECMDRHDDLYKCVREAIPSFPTGQQASRPCGPDDCISVPAQRPAQPPFATTQRALLKEDESLAGRWSWQVDLQSTSFLLGGPLVVQVNASDGGGASSGWIDLQHAETGDPLRIVIDKSPPEPAGVDAVRSTAGTQATNATYAPDPLSFEIVLQDCGADRIKAGGCREGAGVDGDATVVLIRDQETDELLPVPPVGTPAVDPEDGLFHANFAWSGNRMDGPEPGTYEVIVQSRDHAGNILSYNPGLEFFVDREPPLLPPGAAQQFRLPAGQSWLKPGDEVNVTVEARDHPEGATWVTDVTARIGAHTQKLDDSGAGDKYWGNITVPDLLGPDDPDHGTPVRVVVAARDAAANLAVVSSQPFLFYRDPSPVLGPDVLARSGSIDVEWGTDREVEITHAYLVDPLGDAGLLRDRLLGDVTSDGMHHHVAFTGLDDDTEYRLFIGYRDAAGHVKDLHDLFPEIRTLVRQDTDVFFDPIAELTYSGSFNVSGRVEDPVESLLAFHLGAPDTGPFASAPILPTLDGSDRRFSFEFDSAAALPQTKTEAHVVPLVLRMDDGATTWTQTRDVRFDNAPPTAQPDVAGLEPTGGWYNSTILVMANARDDTPPIDHKVRVDGGESTPATQVEITEEGRHVVDFLLHDAAYPPNDDVVSRTFLVDRTPPSVKVSTTLPANATADLQVPLHVLADDPAPAGLEVSGIDAYRIRVDGMAWGAWQPLERHFPPYLEVVLADGEDREQWIEVEVRDAAHNVRREGISFALDRTPPEVLGTRWARTATGEAMLHLVSADPVPSGAHASSGVAAVRYGLAEDGGALEWHDWIESDGLTILEVANATGGDSYALQVRDVAGNVNTTTARPITFVLDGPASPPWQDPAARPAVASHMIDPALAPKQGTVDSRFSFSVLMLPWGDQDPDAVWVEVADKVIILEPRGPPLEGGARLYEASTRLNATPLGGTYQHRFHAMYGDVLLSTPSVEGPLVLAVGLGDEAAFLDGGSEERGIPAAAALPFMAFLAAFLMKRRTTRGDR